MSLSGMERDSFVFYRSFWEGVKGLPEGSKERAVMMIVEYGIDGVYRESDDVIANAIFMMAKPQIDANNKRRENGKKGGIYGVRGGRPKSQFRSVFGKKNPDGDIIGNPDGEKEKTPMGVDIETPNVNVNENVNENEKEKEDRYIYHSDAVEAYERFTKIANEMKEELLVIRPKCSDSQFSKTVAKCWEYCTRDGKGIVNPRKTLRTWFTKQLDFMDAYEAGLADPQTPEQWVKEYNELQGKKFTEKYGAERAREVREWKFNKEQFGVYILNK